MKFSKKIASLSLAVSVAVLLAGCGEGDDTTSTVKGTDTTTTLSGTVADGYLVGAKVCIDKNFNDVCDADEPFAITDNGGRYTLALSSMEATGFPIIVEADENTIDLDTNTRIGEKWHFKAVAGNSSFISPLSTLVAQEMELNTSLTLEQAMLNLQTELGIDINSTVDYVAANNTKAHNAAKIIAKSLANTEKLLTAATTITESPILAASATVATSTSNTRTIRLLAARQVRSQTAAIKVAAEANDTAFLTDVNTADVTAQVSELSASLESSLAQEIKEGLLFMYQEEKVARDVYNVLGQKYPSAKTFANIQLSEQKHIDAVENLCIKYGVDISNVNETAVGEFILPELQTLYNTLIQQGNISLTQAYKVGQAIEIKDIEDIDVRLSATNLPSDIRTVYESLRAGSESHLTAFNKQL
ncbi:MAG: DUF2202 domain-containing protein [Pseudomonadota bacterium]